jgi:hypothetical protein
MRLRAHILFNVRFLVLTSLLVTAATAVAQAQPDGRVQLDDRAPATVISGADDQDHDRRPGTQPLVATAVTATTLPPVAGAVQADLVDLRDLPRPAAVLPFAPKTSPPRARWF